jgi:tetratricopeptide (TPR) repeat protein
MTGAFASVYRLSNVSGTSWAVRCFLEHREDMKERYTAIKNAVRGPAQDLFASFEYLERGIKVRDEWYPILKMEWVDGDSLDRYLDRHVKTRAKVVNLHKQFRELALKLKKAGIAHGDLQHGNILVTDNGLRLIDYDDMFVEGLAGKFSHELGHRNFQHPKRSNDHFNADLDNFSNWVIDLSLKALVVEPDIWRDFDGGDDCLLFRHKDFKEPDESALLKVLLAHDETDLRDSAQLFADVIKLKPTRTPDYQSDARTVGQLLHLASVEVIDQSENDAFGDGQNQSETVSRAAELSFVDYDRWLATVEQRKKQPAKTTVRFLDRLWTAIAILIRKVWRYVVSRIAPYAWARGVVDEGNREYDEGNLTAAVKLYSDAAVVLRTDCRKREARSTHTTAQLLCEVLINLGYCYVRKEQPGTAAHYFREAKSAASPTDFGQTRLQAQLLLAATLFELDRKGDSHMSNALNPLATEINVLKGQIDTAEVLIGAVRAEKEGPFGNMLTFPAMLTELGHGYLSSGDYANAQSSYKAAMEACQWVKEEKHLAKANLIIARAACGFCSTRVGESEVEEAIKEFCQLLDVEGDATILRQLIRTELKGPLRADWKFAELMRALGRHLAGRGKVEQSHLAYRAALMALRLCDDNSKLQLKIVDCLLGLGKSLEAVATIRDNFDWAKKHSAELAQHVADIDDFGHALVISAVVFDDDTHKNRYKCLDALVSKCPGPEQVSRTIAALELTQMGEKLAFAELMIEFARDLKEAGRSKVAKCAYAAAFKAFKRTNVDEQYGASVMECLLAMGDLEVAAGLLLDGGKLEDMVRLMVNVMVQQKTYDRTAICNLLIKVAETQMSRPPASVTEEEIKQTISLLDWCAGEEEGLVIETKERAQRWLENREMAFAHSLVEQGKFGSALELFEKHEGPGGPNVILVQELWVLRYLSAALIDRDRGYVTVADGYAFGCAIQLMSTMRERNVLTPTFAVKVSELIRNAKTASGAQRYVEDVYSIFCESGRGFEHSVLSLRDSLKPNSRSAIEKRLNIKGNEDMHLSISDGNLEFQIMSPDNGDVGESEGAPEEDGDSWRVIHKTFFLIEREEYSAAIAELEKLRASASDNKLSSDALVLRGYCHSLLQDDSQAEQSFKQAVRAVRREDRFRYNKATLCVYLIFLRNRDKQRYLRQLIDPTLEARDLFKIATQIVGRTMNERDNLADVLAGELLEKAEKNEKTTLTSAKIFRAVLTIFGIANPQRRLEIVYCLDAIGKHQSAAAVLKRYVDEVGVDEKVTELVAKLARRHIKTKEMERISEYYRRSGVDFETHVAAAREDHLVGTLSKVLSGHVPRRMLIEVRYDLIGFYGRDILKDDLCERVADAIVDSITDDGTDDRRTKFKVELEGIARVIGKIDASACRRIEQCLSPEEQAIESSEDGQLKLVEQELFESSTKGASRT